MEPRPDGENETGVEQKLAEMLAASPGGDPDWQRGLARWRSGRRVRTRRRIQAGIGLAAVVAAAGLWPESRVYAHRCLEACVVGGQSVVARLRPAAPGARAAAGRASAPELSVTTRTGEVWRLEEHRGQVVVVNFWATWCPPCRRETPWLVDLQARYGGAGLQVLGLSLDGEGWKAVEPFAAAQHVNYPLALAGGRMLRRWSGGDSLPTTVVVDRAGRIAAVETGLTSQEDLERLIQAALQEAPE